MNSIPPSKGKVGVFGWFFGSSTGPFGEVAVGLGLLGRAAGLEGVDA